MVLWPFPFSGMLIILLQFISKLVDTLEIIGGGQVGNLPHLVLPLPVVTARWEGVFIAIGGSAWRRPTNTNADRARLEARATRPYYGLLQSQHNLVTYALGLSPLNSMRRLIFCGFLLF